MAAKKRKSATTSKVEPARGGTRGAAPAKKALTGKKAAAAAPASKAARAKASSAVAKTAPAVAKGAPAPKKRVARAAAPDGGATRAKARPAPAAPSAAGGGPGAGDAAPSFLLQDQSGQTLSSDDLAGKPYVIYFYPKDDTPGCTTEACGFRDTGSDFEGAGVRVIGVSPDSVASHQRFAGKYGLPFTLLSDPKQELASRYGVWAMKKNYGREYMGIVRSTFLVDAEGVIRKAWRSVRVNGHVAEVHAAAAALG